MDSLLWALTLEFLEPNLGPLEERHVFLTTEVYLLPLSKCFQMTLVG